VAHNWATQARLRREVGTPKFTLLAFVCFLDFADPRGEWEPWVATKSLFDVQNGRLLSIEHVLDGPELADPSCVGLLCGSSAGRSGSAPSWMTTKIGSQQKQSPEEGIPEGGPIPLHRDTTKIDAVDPKLQALGTDVSPRSQFKVRELKGAAPASERQSTTAHTARSGTPDTGGGDGCHTGGGGSGYNTGGGGSGYSICGGGSGYNTGGGEGGGGDGGDVGSSSILRIASKGSSAPLFFSTAHRFQIPASGSQLVWLLPPTAAESAQGYPRGHARHRQSARAPLHS